MRTYAMIVMAAATAKRLGIGIFTLGLDVAGCEQEIKDMHRQPG